MFAAFMLTASTEPNGAGACPRPTLASAPTLAATPAAAFGPSITSVTCAADDCTTVARYGKLELLPAIGAEYDNPFDARRVSLDAVFTGPDGSRWQIPGFWDAGTSSHVCVLRPRLKVTGVILFTVTDSRGTSAPAAGDFTVTA